MRFEVVEKVDITNEEPPSEPDNIKTVSVDMMSEARRVLKCWYWVILARKTAALMLPLLQLPLVVRMCFDLLGASDSEAILAELDWKLEKLRQADEMETWLRVFIFDLEVIMQAVSSTSKCFVWKKFYAVFFV